MEAKQDINSNELNLMLIFEIVILSFYMEYPQFLSMIFGNLLSIVASISGNQFKIIKYKTNTKSMTFHLFRNCSEIARNGKRSLRDFITGKYDKLFTQFFAYLLVIFINLWILKIIEKWIGKRKLKLYQFLKTVEK